MKVRLSYSSLLIFALLLVPGTLFCQERADHPKEKKGRWTGEAGINFGTSIREKYSSDIDFFESDDSDNIAYRLSSENNLKLLYQSPKFEFKTDASLKINRQIIDKDAVSLKTDLQEEEVLTGMFFDQTRTKKRSMSGRVRLDGIFKPSAKNRYTATLITELSSDKPNSMHGTMQLSEISNMTYTYESSNFRKFTVNPSFEWFHSMENPNRELAASVKWLYSNDNRNTEWAILGADFNMDYDEYDEVDDDFVNINSVKVYMLTPLYIDNVTDFNVNYKDRQFAGVRGLMTDFSLTGKISRDMDYYSASNLVDEIWLDSLSYRNSFDYVALTAEPKAHANYKVGQFEIDLAVSAQYFTDRLNNKEQNKYERLDPGRLDPLFNFKTNWRPNRDHNIGFSSSRTIKRPDYLQLCWFQRPGEYINEINEGNPDLEATKTIKAATNYSYSHGRFSSSLEIGYTYESDRMERTFRNAQTADGNNIRIISWKNAGYSSGTNAKVTFKWMGRQVKANILANYNYSSKVDDSGKETESGDYKIEGDVAYIFGFGLTLQAKARYQSRIRQVYSSSAEYCAFDFHIGQRIGKHFELYAEGRDLLDKDLDIITYSEDMTEIREEILKNNRMLLLLGLNYSF